jgi:hypothetical protein
MCGIFGILDRKTVSTPSKNLLETIARTLRHRGPDNYGIYAAPAIGLVLHNRFETAANLRRGYLGSLNLLNYHLRTLPHRNDSLGMAASIEAGFLFSTMT